MMARFDTSGLDDLIRDMNAMGESTGELAEEMLFAGADVVKESWRYAAAMHDLKDTGDMIESIGYPRQPTRAGDVISLDIYPQGKDRKGVRNAEKAFILHYGTSSAASIKRGERRAWRKGKKYKNPGIPATHWVDDADDIAGDRVLPRLLAIFDRWLAEHNMK